MLRRKWTAGMDYPIKRRRCVGWMGKFSLWIEFSKSMLMQSQTWLRMVNLDFKSCKCHMMNFTAGRFRLRNSSGDIHTTSSPKPCDFSGQVWRSGQSKFVEFVGAFDLKLFMSLDRSPHVHASILFFKKHFICIYVLKAFLMALVASTKSTPLPFQCIWHQEYSPHLFSFVALLLLLENFDNFCKIHSCNNIILINTKNSSIEHRAISNMYACSNDQQLILSF